MTLLHVTSSTGTFRVFDQGVGTPLLFVHGFPLDHTMWRGQLEFVAARGRVIAPDLRGFGGSSPAAETIAMETFADDLAELLDTLGVNEPVVFIGLSMGGYIAWQFWRRHAARLKALVLCDTRAAADAPAAAAGRLEMAERVLAAGSRLAADAMLPRLLAAENPRPEIAAELRQVILATDPRSIAAAQRGMAARPDVTEWLPSIAVPTLVVVGQHDAISPPDEMERIAAAIPGARFVTIPAAGHMAPLEKPDEFNAALAEFLATLPT